MLKLTRDAVFVLVLSTLLFACSSKKGSLSKAEPLPSITPEVSMKTLWSTNGGDGLGKQKQVLAPALVDLDGDAYVVSADNSGKIMLTNASTGSRTWSQDVKVPVSSALGSTESLVLVGSHQADVVALDKTTGEEKWRSKVSSEVMAAPMGRSEGIAVLSIDSRLHGLDPATGEEKWVYEAAAPALKLRGGSTPMVFDGVALVGFASGQSGLFDLKSGRAIWLDTIAQPRGRTEIERMVDINGRLVRRANMAYIVTFQGKVAALELRELKTLWTRDASSYVGLDAGGRSVVVTDSQGKLYAFDRMSGETLWSQEALHDRRPTAPVIIKDYVVIGDAQGHAYVFSLDSGKLLAHRQLEGSGFFAPPLADNQDVIFQSKTGRLLKLSVEPLGS
jgi:outer membrane protein assembly factor BamB